MGVTYMNSKERGEQRDWIAVCTLNECTARSCMIELARSWPRANPHPAITRAPSSQALSSLGRFRVRTSHDPSLVTPARCIAEPGSSLHQSEHQATSCRLYAGAPGVFWQSKGYVDSDICCGGRDGRRLTRHVPSAVLPLSFTTVDALQSIARNILWLPAERGERVVASKQSEKNVIGSALHARTG